MSTTLTKDVPVMDVDLYSEEMIADPWPTLRRIREAGPVVWTKCGHWMSAQDRRAKHYTNPVLPLLVVVGFYDRPSSDNNSALSRMPLKFSVCDGAPKRDSLLQ